MHINNNVIRWKDQISEVFEYMNGSLQDSYVYYYDSIGNLTSITSNGGVSKSFDWEGRRLIEYKVGNITYSSYNYDDQGIRTSKSHGGVVTEYFLDGSQVLAEKTGNNVIYYTYDVDGSLLSMIYLGNEYFYIKNMQKDVIEIVNSSGATVATYLYDAWGNIVHTWDSGLNIASINPYRYRSYYYDQDTGLYYLNSRYYDPHLGRFISADSIDNLDLSGESGLNLYAYCNNNPVMNIDRDGHFWETVIDIGFAI